MLINKKGRDEIFTSKNEMKLKNEDIFSDDKDKYKIGGLQYIGNPEEDGLYHLSVVMLDKPKYRKFFLKSSFKDYIFDNINNKNNSINKAKNCKTKNNNGNGWKKDLKIDDLKKMGLDSDVIKWLTIYKWFLRKWVPFIENFDYVRTLAPDGIPFLQEWIDSIELLYNNLKNIKSTKEDEGIDYIDALKKCEEFGLLKKRFSSVFCHNYNAHIVYDVKKEKEFVKNGVLHDDCEGPMFLGGIYEIDRDFFEFWFKDKGTTFELWFYYVLMHYLQECYKKKFDIFRSVEVYHKDFISSPLTEIDILIAVEKKLIACECKNTSSVGMSMILKFYGVMKMLDINYGIFACSSEFNGERIKTKIFDEYGIFIIDGLMWKSERDIFMELNEFLSSI